MGDYLKRGIPVFISVIFSFFLLPTASAQVDDDGEKDPFATPIVSDPGGVYVKPAIPDSIEHKQDSLKVNTEAQDSLKKSDVPKTAKREHHSLQPGISGILTDSISGEAMIGAVVNIEGSQLGAASDIDGGFHINNVPDDIYTIRISYLGYRTKIVKNIQVLNGKSLRLHIPIQSESGSLQQVVVIGTRITNTEKAVVQEIKNSEQVVSAISAEQISKSQDRDAAQIIRRVPGVTIVDNRFVMVRGLSQRYNNVMINGVIAPSTEPDSRAFAFDIVPSSMLDRLLIYKSGSAEIPGDFGGAVIKLYTKNTVDHNYINVGLVTGVRAGTTFNEFKTYKGSNTDFLGFDNGSRALPSSFPKNISGIEYNFPQLEAQSKKLANTWAIENKTATPDIRFNLEIARRFFVRNAKLSNITNISYSNVFQYAEARRARYDNYDLDNTSITKDDYMDSQYFNSVRSGILHNWALQINKDHKIDFRNMFTQLGSKETIVRNGEDLFNQSEVKSYSLRYMSRGIYTGQLQGSHDFNHQRSNFTWIAGLANTKRNEPDWKRARTQRPSGSEGDFRVDIPSSASITSAARFFSELNETTVMTSGDFEHKLVKDRDSSGVQIRMGYYLENKNRDFEARWMSYRKTSGTGTDFNESLEFLPIENIFSNENINASNGFVLVEGTNPTDRYYARNILTAGYAGLSLPFFKNFNLSTGARVEYNHQTLRLTPGGRDTVDNPITSLLPFANLTYNISEKMILRGAYSKTVNRAEFREIAPFSFYDFEFFADRVGNPLLKMANIHNADLRWELYPSPSEMISFGLFYKQFINPIESYVIRGGSNPVFIFNNADLALSQGAEVEIRKSLYDFSELKIVKNISVLLNASIINSKVDLGAQAKGLARNRPLQGQSPYVLNTGIYYSDDSSRIQVNILYNVFGKRIFSVGDDEIRTIYEMPRNVLDITISKGIGERLTLQLGITDLLNQKVLLREDGNYDSKIDNDLVDKPILAFRRGQYLTFGASYKF